MRLFIAVCFSERYRQAVDEIGAALAAEARYARRTLPENYHLTLVFLGEQTDTAPIAEVMDGVRGEPFTLKSGGVGCFRRAGGDTYWLGLAEQPLLRSIQSQLTAGLKARGYRLEDRRFRPHLTLLREAVFPPAFDCAAFNARLPVLEERVDAISLMLSTREQGRLVYRELYRNPLP